MSALASSSTTEQFIPVQFLELGARRYGKALGIAAPLLDYRRVRLDPALGQRISEAYMAAPLWDEQAIPAYQAFRSETIQQFRFLTSGPAEGGLGVTVSVVEYDPYQTARSMAEDLGQLRLKIYSSRACGNPHPFLSDWENDVFRAVHDAFGHAATGCGFDADGEEGAWLKHSFMYSRLARRAVATETRGQSCALLYHYGGKRFPAQKLALLPADLTDPDTALLATITELN